MKKLIHVIRNNDRVFSLIKLMPLIAFIIGIIIMPPIMGVPEFFANTSYLLQILSEVLRSIAKGASDGAAANALSPVTSILFTFCGIILTVATVSKIIPQISNRREKYLKSKKLEKPLFKYLFYIIVSALSVIYIIYTLVIPHETYLQSCEAINYICGIISVLLNLDNINAWPSKNYGFNLLMRCAILLAYIVIWCVLRLIFAWLTQPDGSPPVDPHTAELQPVEHEKDSKKKETESSTDAAPTTSPLRLWDTIYEEGKFKWNNIVIILTVIDILLGMLRSVAEPEKALDETTILVGQAVNAIKAVLYISDGTWIETKPWAFTGAFFFNVLIRLFFGATCLFIAIVLIKFIGFVKRFLEHGFDNLINELKAKLDEDKAELLGKFLHALKVMAIVVTIFVICGMVFYASITALNDVSSLQGKPYTPLVYVATGLLVIIFALFMFGFIQVVFDVIRNPSILRPRDKMRLKITRLFKSLLNLTISILMLPVKIAETFRRIISELISVIKDIALSLMMFFKSYQKDTLKNRILSLGASLAALASIFTTFSGLNTFMILGGWVSVIVAVLITTAVQFIMLIIGTKLGEALREKKELKHLLRDKQNNKLTKWLVNKCELFFMKSNRRLKPSRIVICFIMMALVSTLFSYASLFENYNKRARLYNVLYTNIIDNSINFLNEELAKLDNAYKDNNANIKDLIEQMYKLADPDKVSTIARQKAANDYPIGTQQYYTQIGSYQYKLQRELSSIASFKSAINEFISFDDDYFDDKMIAINMYVYYYLGDNWANVPTIPMGGSPEYIFKQIDIIDAHNNLVLTVNEFTDYLRDNNNRLESKGFIRTVNQNRGVIELKREPIKMTKYALLMWLFTEYETGISNITGNSGIESLSKGINASLEKNKQISDMIKTIGEDIIHTNNLTLSNLQQKVFVSITDKFTRLKDVQQNEYYEEANSALNSIDKIMRLLLTLRDGDVTLNQRITVIKEYKNYMASSTSDFIFAYDVLLKGLLFNKNRNTINDIYQSWGFAFLLFSIAVALDTASIFSGYFYSKSIYKLQRNKYMSEFGFLQYDATLKDYFQPPEDKNALDEQRNLIKKLFAGEKFSEQDPEVQTLRDELKIYVPVENQDEDKGKQKDKDKNAPDGYMSLGSFRLWLKEHVNENWKAYEDEDEMVDESIILDNIAVKNSMQTSSFSKILHSLFFKDGRFDSEGSLLMALDRNGKYIDKYDCIAIPRDMLNALPNSTVSQIATLRKYKGAIEDIKDAANKEYIHICNDIVEWLRCVNDSTSVNTVDISIEAEILEMLVKRVASPTIGVKRLSAILNGLFIKDGSFEYDNSIIDALDKYGEYITELNAFALPKDRIKDIDKKAQKQLARLISYAGIIQCVKFKPGETPEKEYYSLAPELIEWVDLCRISEWKK